MTLLYLPYLSNQEATARIHWTMSYALARMLQYQLLNGVKLSSTQETYRSGFREMQQTIQNGSHDVQLHKNGSKGMRKLPIISYCRRTEPLSHDANQTEDKNKNNSQDCDYLRLSSGDHSAKAFRSRLNRLIPLGRYHSRSPILLPRVLPVHLLPIPKAQKVDHCLLVPLQHGSLHPLELPNEIS